MTERPDDQQESSAQAAAPLQRATACRGVRGATIAADNTADAIRDAIRELVLEMAERNDIDPLDVACVLFTTTPDLTASFPAEAVRHMGWDSVPLLGAVEMAKPGAPGRCIRVLVQWNTTRTQREIEHVYHRGTDVLLTSSPSDSFGLGGAPRGGE
ncbi:MAG: chorismate mutase [Thermoleophilia bacterium]|nr:chorismate mutase [Thermoleophilia bacterium]